jgi:hypothetical protein
VRPLRIPLLILLVALLAAIGAWWTWPERWTVEEEAPAERVRVGQDRRPLWARRRSGAPALPEAPFPRPAASQAPVEAPASSDLDTGLPRQGVAHLVGYLVDDAGRAVSRGSTHAVCTTLDPETGEPLMDATTHDRVDDGGWYTLKVRAPARCTLTGFRPDGLLRAWAPEQVLWVEPGEWLETDVVVPSSTTGGIGINLDRHPEGIEVLRVHEGTPAWEAGLQDGDIIVEVGGVPAVDLDVDAFTRRVTGAVGTEVRLTVLTEGPDGPVEETHALERRFLDESLFR